MVKLTLKKRVERLENTVAKLIELAELKYDYETRLLESRQRTQKLLASAMGIEWGVHRYDTHS